jgi:hypothetical protein
MSFTYLYIPADEAEPIVELSASKAGGLEHDALRKNAEKQFNKGSIDKEMQRAAVIEQLREKGIDAAKVDEFMKGNASGRLAGSVEIIALAVPTPANNFSSVSLYCDGNSSFKPNGKVPNVRATQIAKACGHHSLVVMGDCFAGRALDDERVEWERLDLRLQDLRSDASWVLATAKANQGKNLSSFSTSGALGAMHDAAKGGALPAPPAVAPALTASEFAGNEAFVWTQNDEDVEVRMRLPTGLVSKQLCVQISADRLYVGRKNAASATEAALEGVDARFSADGAEGRGARLQGQVAVADCTWSVADEREGRMLTVSLSKAKAQTWKSLIV